MGVAGLMQFFTGRTVPPSLSMKDNMKGQSSEARKSENMKLALEQNKRETTVKNSNILDSED